MRRSRRIASLSAAQPFGERWMGHDTSERHEEDRFAGSLLLDGPDVFGQTYGSRVDGSEPGGVTGCVRDGPTRSRARLLHHCFNRLPRHGDRGARRTNPFASSNERPLKASARLDRRRLRWDRSDRNRARVPHPRCKCAALRRSFVLHRPRRGWSGRRSAHRSRSPDRVAWMDRRERETDSASRDHHAAIRIGSRSNIVLENSAGSKVVRSPACSRWICRQPLRDSS